jgi:hypothetical protein
MINASAIRQWARENDIPVGSRGRLDPELKSAYLAANPKDARALAAEGNIEVPARGRLSESTITSIVSLLP